VNKNLHVINAVSNFNNIFYLQLSIPGGLRFILDGCLLPPLNHSDADKVGFQITLVGGKRSSWNNSLWLKQVNISALSCQ